MFILHKAKKQFSTPIYASSFFPDLLFNSVEKLIIAEIYEELIGQHFNWKS